MFLFGNSQKSLGQADSFLEKAPSKLSPELNLKKDSTQRNTLYEEILLEICNCSIIQLEHCEPCTVLQL